jgi:hypothetical protein
MREDELRVGSEMASTLAGSWRRAVSQLRHEELERISSALIDGAAAALTWFKIRQQRCKLPNSVARRFYEIYIEYAVRAAMHEAELQRISEALNNRGVRSILLKGWSLGRLYPESGLRPSGDIDLWIDPLQRGTAETVLRDLNVREAIDLEHDQVRRFEILRFRDVYPDCETAYLGSTPIRVLGREDQIRFACFHFLKHGGWRPIWLCDIAVALESSGVSFDWRRCLGPNPRHARWVGSIISLAFDLLGARIPDEAPAILTSRSPNWLKRTVLREWSCPTLPSHPPLKYLLRSSMTQGCTVKNLLKGRWRNAIQATVDCNGRFNGMPRWPYQAFDAAHRATQFCYRFWPSLNPKRSQAAV